MHTGFQRLKDLMEGLANHLGLVVLEPFHEAEGVLRGVVGGAKSEAESVSPPNALLNFVEKTQEFATVNALTIDSQSSERDGNYFVILHIFTDQDFEKWVKSDKIDNFSKLISGYFEYELKRIYRNRDELPYPDLPHDHEKNRSKPRLAKVFSARVEDSLVDEVDEAISKLGVTKREAVEEALRDWLEKHDPTNG